LADSTQGDAFLITWDAASASLRASAKEGERLDLKEHIQQRSRRRYGCGRAGDENAERQGNQVTLAFGIYCCS
jgi:hypothetical protein